MNQPLFPVSIREHVPLAPYTTLEVGGPARFFAEAGNESQVIEALDFAAARSLPVFVLGGGSNIVVADAGFDGLVLRVVLHGIRQRSEDVVTAAAGEDWDGLVRWCVERNLAGIECLSGIPGSVGATPVQNVGAYGQEVGEVILSVRALDRQTRQIVSLNNFECGFAYRTSIFSGPRKESYVVLSVTFALHAGGAPAIRYPDLRLYFANRHNPPDLAGVREAVLNIRRDKSMVLRKDDPDAKSAGSFFKNPVVAAETARQAEEAARRRGTLKTGGIMPQYPTADGNVKLSAAWLIEHAGIAKGYSRGPVGVSSRHSLALINRGGATAGDLLGLMQEIQSAVQSVFGVALDPEPVFVGF
jgi:UDP-N-acetylmuramate dehydrogenase